MNKNWTKCPSVTREGRFFYRHNTKTLAVLAYFASRPGWQTFDTDCRETCEAVADLVNLGFLRRAACYGQAKFTGKITALDTPTQGRAEG